MNDVTPILTPVRRPDDEVEARLEKMLREYEARVGRVLLDNEIARRRASVVVSCGQDANGKLVLTVERGQDRLRDALKHPRAVKADIVTRPRLAAAPTQGSLFKAS